MKKLSWWIYLTFRRKPRKTVIQKKTLLLVNACQARALHDHQTGTFIVFVDFWTPGHKTAFTLGQIPTSPHSWIPEHYKASILGQTPTSPHSWTPVHHKVFTSEQTLTFPHSWTLEHHKAFTPGRTLTLPHSWTPGHHKAFTSEQTPTLPHSWTPGHQAPTTPWGQVASVTEGSVRIIAQLYFAARPAAGWVLMKTVSNSLIYSQW